MAIYHLHCDIIGRSGGRSATAAAAYRATCTIEDRTTGEKFDYSRKEKALYSEIVTNGNVPEWAKDRQELWNRVEEKENRKNSQFCRSFDIGLMKEFDLETNIKLIKKWINENYVDYGLVADLAIHAPHKNTDGTTNENTHAHILIPTRFIGENGWEEKDRLANDREFLNQVRKSWADIVNKEFKVRGMAERIDERTLEEQGIDREPQQHMGAKATAKARRGEETNRKRYKSEQEKAEEIVINDKDLHLENDVTFIKLVVERENILAEERQKKYQEEAQQKAIQALKQREKQQEEAKQKELQKWYDKIEAMTPQQWQSFTKNMGVPGLVDEAYGEYSRTIFEADRKARVIWVEENIETVTKEFTKNLKSKKSDYDSYMRQKPSKIADRPNALKAFLYDYQTDDGQVFPGKQYDQYRMAQQSLINKWQAGKAVPESEYKVAQKELKDCYDKNYNDVRIAIERHHPSLRENMKEGAKKLFQKLEEFRPVRAMINAVQHFKDKKTNELKAWNQERNLHKGQTINKGITRS